MADEKRELNDDETRLVAAIQSAGGELQALIGLVPPGEARDRALYHAGEAMRLAVETITG